MQKGISKQLKKEFLERFATLVTGAFTFVAGLAWNDAVQHIIKEYIAPGKTILSQTIYAVVVTVIAIIAIVQINSLARKIEKE